MKIALLGPESSGKTTLALALAERLPGAFVPEYGRAYSEQHGNQSTALDLAHIAAGQLLAEDEAAQAQPGFPLICDTDVLTTCTFAELYLGYCPPVLEELSTLRTYDLTLLLPPTLPHEADAIRLFGHRRQEHYDLLLRRLRITGRPFEIVKATGLEDRIQFALYTITSL